jgi:hypothetical protein
LLRFVIEKFIYSKLSFIFCSIERPVLHLDLSTPQGFELYQHLVEQQEQVLFLEVPTPQRPELHKDVSTSQGPELYLDVSGQQKLDVLLNLSIL